MVAPLGHAVAPALVVVWSADHPERVGEVAFLTGDEDTYAILGRDEEPDDDVTPRVHFAQRRPGDFAPASALAGISLSRKQLRLRVIDDALDIENIGKAVVSVDGRAIPRGETMRVPPGAVVSIRKLYLLLYTLRPVGLPDAPAASTPHPFGGPDADGIVGESPAAWELRADIAAAAASREHVFVHGPTGTGKELVASAIHRQSKRPGAFIVHSVANLVSTLVESILFGNAANYPNPGTPDRAGCFGEARGGTLFLDEFGEPSIETQARLLRALQGDYVRLGEVKTRIADVVVVAATNRDHDRVKLDVLKRFKFHIELPSLDARREDVPLLARAAVLDAYRADPTSAAARFVRDDGDGSPRVYLPEALVLELLRAPLDGNVRDVQAMVVRAIAGARGAPRSASPAASRVAGPATIAPPPDPEARALDELLGGLDGERRAIIAALEGHHWNQAAAAATLGMSRYALKRRMDALGIKTTK